MMTGFRQIDARGVWRGEVGALANFAQAYNVDCGADDTIWHRVYGWTTEALQTAKARARLAILEKIAEGATIEEAEQAAFATLEANDAH